MSGSGAPLAPDPPWRIALGAQSILIQAAYAGIRIMIGYRALELGADALFLGLLAASFAAPALIAALPAGLFAGSLGGALLTTVGLVAMGVGAVVALLPTDSSWLLAVGCLLGVGFLASMIGQQTFVAQRNTGAHADGDFGTLSATASIGQTVGPPLISTLVVLAVPGRPAAEPDTFVGIAIGLALLLAAVPVGFWLHRADRAWRARRLPARSATPAAEEGGRSLRRNVGLLSTPGVLPSLIVRGAVLVTMDLGYAFLPVWANEHGVDASILGWMLAVRAAVSVVGRIGLSRLVGRFGRRTLLVVSMAIGVAALVALPFADVWGALAVMVALGITLGIPPPVTLAWVVAITRPSDHGAAVGLRMASNRLAQVAIPIAVGAVAGAVGSAGIFWANAVLLGAAVGVVAVSDPDARA